MVSRARRVRVVPCERDNLRNKWAGAFKLHGLIDIYKDMNWLDNGHFPHKASVMAHRSKFEPMLKYR